MGRNLEKDAVEMAAKNQRILEEGFAIFAEHGIDNVTMSDVAKGAGIGISSLYRYYKTKTELVLAIGTWAWQRYLEQVGALDGAEKKTACAAENVAFFLDAFLDLYRNHKDLLRFNQFFNGIFFQVPAHARLHNSLSCRDRCATVVCVLS